MSTKTASAVNSTLAKTLALAALTVSSTSAMATFITYETRATTQEVNRSDYSASWLAQTSTINSSSLDSFERIRGNGRNFHSRLTIEFDYLDPSQDWLFQFAPDAGFGGAVYANGALVQSNTTDLWWGFNWNRTSEILTATSASFALGTNVLELYWAEGCCDGGQSGRLSVNGGQDWMSLSVDNLELVAVPEPGMLSLMAGGLLGFGVSRRQKHRVR